MNWCNDKDKLIHGIEYLVCLDLENETYSLQTYLKHDDSDVIFKEEGFYWFDTNEDVLKYSRIQPKFWLNIIKPNVGLQTCPKINRNTTKL